VKPGYIQYLIHPIQLGRYLYIKKNPNIAKQMDKSDKE